MAFKMTPGIKGNSTNNSIMGGGCGGDNQPPCPPRFQAEKMMAPVADKSSSSRSKSIRPKNKAAVVAPAPAPAPKLQINLPKGYEFGSKIAEMNFYEKVNKAIEKGAFESQEQLDKAVADQLKGPGPKDPGGPVIVNPGKPVLEAPALEAPIKGGGEFEAVPVKGVAAKIAK